jgi:hypothetical protein
MGLNDLLVRLLQAMFEGQSYLRTPDLGLNLLPQVCNVVTVFIIFS